VGTYVNGEQFIVCWAVGGDSCFSSVSSVSGERLMFVRVDAVVCV